MTKMLPAVEEYISKYPEETQKRLYQMRKLIFKIAPKAEEVISYSMPAYKLNGIIVWFAAYKKHIGLYPMASGITKFEKEISKFKHARGSVQFPLDAPLPVVLIEKMIAFRVKENIAKERNKSKKSGKSIRRP